ncbi:MAG: hypothetical protein M0Q53_05065 [Prolixibacteraceae bacterium]|jgi:hypothetical protein|nr:hypothetical protein [Prolixibacteraceae bacterium]
MKIFMVAICWMLAFGTFAQDNAKKLGYHEIRLDAKGNLLPWFSTDPGKSYDHIIRKVWNFWNTMRRDPNGLPYYMNHQIWTRDRDEQRGIGGDQIAMALSAWRLLYGYLGDERIVDNMRFMADYYLTHSLSPADSKWPNLPFPYNTFTYSGIYDGDMILGKGFTQPDKAGSFGIELVNLYKMTKKQVYLNAAVDIANTLAEMAVVGDETHSPLPFRVNVHIGKVGVIRGGEKNELAYNYTSNWTGTLQLFSTLESLGVGNREQYRKSFQLILSWMKTYPLKSNKWGPFFEDVAEWSDTQINAVTFARYMMENPKFFDNGTRDARAVLDWVYKELGNDKWLKQGVRVVNEQTSYRIPGNSHTARQGSTELLYALTTGDQVSKERGIRQLNWASYMVNDDGESTYPNNETWLTDGYGDLVRHFLRAISYFPELSPDDQNHLVGSSSVIKRMEYKSDQIKYETFDEQSDETFRLITKPTSISFGEERIECSPGRAIGEGWSWSPMDKGGIVIVSHLKNRKITIAL